MVRDRLVVKMLVTFLFVILASILFAQEYKLEKNDIKQFLAFADEYRTLAKKFLQNTDKMSISDIFYTENSKMLTATNNFLKAKKWTNEKMNDFLYYVSCAMDAISFYEEYGYPEETGKDESDPFKDIPQAVITVVKEFREVLLKYFPVTDFNAQYDDFTDEQKTNSAVKTDTKTEDPEDDLPPVETYSEDDDSASDAG